MKNTSASVAIIVSVALVASAFMLSSAIKEFGRSLESAAAQQRHTAQFPSRFTISFEGGNSPVRFDANVSP